MIPKLYPWGYTDFVDVNDFDLMWLSETEAELRFMFHSNKEVGEYGVVYSTTQQMPTIQNASAMTVGSGGISGEPIVVLEPLEPNTTYYTRAFVTTSQNGGTYYYSPNVVSFTTPEVQKDPNENDNPDPKLAPRR